MTDEQLILSPQDADATALASRGNGQELASRQTHVVAPAPTIEQMLIIAIERKVDPDAMQKLVELHERVAVRRAEAAFNAAMSNFRAECPPILKTKDANNQKTNALMYRYADLAGICLVIDPVLHRYGLSYTFDFDLQGNLMTTVCTVHHVDGHSRSAKFTCDTASGTPLMNSAQKAASATTFGRRYSLQGALGICTDTDDDGRYAAPSPAPSHDETAPRVAPRSERASQEQKSAPIDGEPRVSADAINELMADWAKKHNGKTRADFLAFSRSVLRTDSALDKPALWSVDAIDAVREAL